MSDEHEPRWHGTGYGGGAMVCRCGDQCEDGYNAHVERILAECIAEARRDGAAEAWEVAAQRRSEARRYWVAWQSARMRAAALLRGDA